MISNIEIVMKKDGPYEAILQMNEKTNFVIKDIESICYFKPETQEWIEINCKSPFILSAVDLTYKEEI